MARVAAAVVTPAVAVALRVPAAVAAAAAVAAVTAAAVAQSEHAAAAADAAAVVADVAVAHMEADSVEVAGCETLDDARSCFHGRALPLLETQHAQWRKTGGCCHHLHSANAEEDHLSGTELEQV